MISTLAARIPGPTAAASDQSRLRVLHLGKFYPPYRGGVETYLAGLCQHLTSKVQLRVIVAGDCEPRAELIGGVPVLRLKTWKVIASTPVCAGMIEAIRSWPCDIVHLHWPNPFAVLTYLMSGSPAKLVITYHSDVIRQRFLAALFSPILKYLLSRADAIIVTSPNFVEHSSTLRRYRHHCRVVPLGICPEDLLETGKSEAQELRARFGTPIVMAAGRLVYYKGLEYLIDAMKSVKAHLVVVGTGPLREQLQLQIRRDGLTDRVTLVGEVDRIAPYYHAADVFVLASTARSEAFGIVQLEAMACGKPVINTRLDSGVPFVSFHGATGLTVEPANAAELGSALRVLLHNDRFRNRLGAAGRCRVAQEFRLELMAERTLALYWELAGQQQQCEAAEAS
jgi:glycosyltransferase involved in cell wall biosynthesis